MRVLLAQINPIIADLQGNTEKIIHSIEEGKQQKADLVLFPELALTGYPPEDFLLLPHFVDSIEAHLQEIMASTQGITVVVGLPRSVPSNGEKYLYNSAAVIEDGALVGYQDKSLLPTYDLFDERRYFDPATESQVWNLCGKKIGITICEDIWQHSQLVKETSYRHDPVQDFIEKDIDLLLNLSASPYSTKQFTQRFTAASEVAKTLKVPVCMCNQVGGNDSIIFDGKSFVVNAKGDPVALAKSFEEDNLTWSMNEQKEIKVESDLTKELHAALCLGIRDYFQKQGFKKACIGLSGGVDSAVVLCLAVEALGAENVLAVAMPSRFSSESSLEDAQQLVEKCAVKLETISIEKPFTAFLELLEPHFDQKPFDATEENIQARIRGLILMALSNKHGYILLSTGNKSEMAMGYSTLYGDLCGGLAVLSDVVKKQVYQLAEFDKRIPRSIIEKPPSAELRPNQKDSDSLPPYDVIDQVLSLYVEEHHSPKQICEETGIHRDIVDELVKKIHANEYKRRQSAPGLRVSEKAFTIGRKFPIVHRCWYKST